MLIYLLTAVAAFGVFYLLDKGFTKTFRGTETHRSGLSVRLPKRICTAGILLCILAALVLVVDFGEKSKVAMLIPAAIVAVMGIGLIIYYADNGRKY